MTEKQLQKSICQYLKLAYKGLRFHSDMAGTFLSGKWSLMKENKDNNSHSGYPDLVIYKKSNGYMGLALELKREGNSPFKKDGTLKKDVHLEEQQAWLDVFAELGFKAQFVVGFDEAMAVINKYLSKRASLKRKENSQ